MYNNVTDTRRDTELWFTKEENDFTFKCLSECAQMFLRRDLEIEDSNYKSERIKNLSFFLSGWTCIPFRGFSIYVVRH